jgi:predicted metal-binding protein
LPVLKIKLKDIIFDPKVQTYCISPSFKCPSYGHSWACPPEAPYMEELVAEFKEFYLVYYQLDLSEYIKNEKANYPKKSEKSIKNMLYSKGILHNKLEREITNFIENYSEPYEERLILWDGYCRICSNKIDKGCTYDSGNPCRYPIKRKYSMEAVGVEVTKTVSQLNLNIQWPPTDFLYRFGLICFK